MMIRHSKFKPFTGFDELEKAIKKGSTVYYRDTLDVRPTVIDNDSLTERSYKNLSYMIYNNNLGAVKFTVESSQRYLELVEGINLNIPLQDLLLLITVYARTTIEDVRSKSQRDTEVGVRGVFTFLAYYGLNYGLKTIGPFINRDRTTISKAKKIIEHYIDVYDYCQFKIVRLINFINKYHTLITTNGITTDQELRDALQESEDWKDTILGSKSFFEYVNLDDYKNFGGAWDAKSPFPPRKPDDR